MGDNRWTGSEIEIFERIIDLGFEKGLDDWSITMLSGHGIAPELIQENFESFDDLQNQFAHYWAWKETFQLIPRLVEIRSPVLRLITLMRFGFKHNRYIKFFPVLKNIQLPDEAQEVLKEASAAKVHHFSQILIDRGVDSQTALTITNRVIPTYYGWAADKDDVVTNDIQKAGILGFYKAFLFPSFFRGTKLTAKDI